MLTEGLPSFTFLLFEKRNARDGNELSRNACQKAVVTEALATANCKDFSSGL